MANINIDGILKATNLKIGGVDVIKQVSSAELASPAAWGMRLSNGLVINWGITTPAIGGTSVTFPVPFSTTSYCAGGAAIDTVSTQIRNLAVTSTSTTQMTCKGQWGKNNAGNSGGDVTFRWVAIGK
jgi:hypothetical protein